MHGSFIHIFFEMNAYKFISAIYISLLALVLLFVFILGMVIYKKSIERKRKMWRDPIATIISQVIFFTEEESETFDIDFGNKKLLQNDLFRQCLIEEVIHARKNLTGTATTNLKKLYEILNLDKDSFKKVNSKRWHIKVKGLQELSVMEQVKYVKPIFRLTNNKNELVRAEAQSALISFYGFPGLRFLNITTYPISQWHQIQLLNNLHGPKPDNLDSIKKWLRSPNESVINFSLKLATFYNCYNVYESVINCLQHPGIQVRLGALDYLKKMPREDTPEKIIEIYPSGNKKIKLLILDILKEAGTEKQLLFLLKQLHNADNDIKASAAKTLSCLHPLGTAFLQTHLFADENPWKAIFLQIETERAA
jgi:hypothetical protein